jgi:uncharacterized protein YcfL
MNPSEILVELAGGARRACCTGTVSCLLLLAACKTGGSPAKPQNTYIGTEGAVEVEEEVGDRALERKFVLLGIKSERRDGRLHVQFDLKNTTTSELAVEWSIEWMDDRGFRINTQPHWSPVRVGGNGAVPVQQTAPVPEAVTFKLHVRRSSPVS